MALFAQSLNTLKKRATTLASELVKGDDGGRKKGEAQDIGPPSLETQSALRGFFSPADAQQGGGGLLSEGPLLVRYEVQNGDESERELSAFALPPCSGPPTLGHLKKHFPVAGRFHLRFRAPTLDGSFGGYIWMDLANDGEPVPVTKGEVSMKALRVPDTADAPRSFESLPNSVLAAAVAAAAAAPPPPSMPWGAASPKASPVSSPPRSIGGSPPRSPSPDQDYFGQGSPPSSSPERSQPSSEQRATLQVTPGSGPAAPGGAAATPGGLPADLMDFGGGAPGAPGAPGALGAAAAAASLPPAVAAAAAAASAAAAAPPAPPVVLDRDKLRAEREAREQQRVRDAAQRQAEQQRKEVQLKADKVNEGNKLDSEMQNWAKTSDGQAYKDIKVLLSTMHSVTWGGCTWKELPLSELMSGPNSVKKAYRKAILICHPDKQTEADPEQQVRADRIFQALNEAFKISGGD